MPKSLSAESRPPHAKRVINLFEVIHIQQHEPGVALASLSAQKFAFQSLLKQTTVRDFQAGVHQRDALQLAILFTQAQRQIVREADEASILRLAKKIQEGITLLRLPASSTFQSSVSIGIASAREAASIHEWLRRADEALYQVKRAGRNDVHVWRASSLNTLSEVRD